MRLLTYICAVIAPITTLVIVHSGCSYAEYTRGTGAMSRINEVSDSSVFDNDRKTSNYVNSQTDNPLERTSTGSNLRPRVDSLPQNGAKNHHVGGQLAKIEEFPYIASLELRNFHSCTMCIITEWWLLTAGHCTVHPFPEGISPTDFTVIAGTPLITINMPEDCVKDEVRRDVDELVMHPDFSAVKFAKDLALVHVSSPLPFSDRIQPAPLPSSRRNTQICLATSPRCQVVGWRSLPMPQSGNESKPGDLSTSEMISDNCKKYVKANSLLGVQKLTVPVISSQDCILKSPWEDEIVNTKTHICTASDDGEDACNSDSGSLLVCNRTVVALVSFGMRCGSQGIPTVFMRTDSELNWILKTVHRDKANLASPSPNVIAIITFVQLAMAVARICYA